MTTLIFEPHADDALLSASSVLLAARGDCHIITLYDNGDSSRGLSKHYDVTVNSAHILPSDKRVAIFDWTETKRWTEPYTTFIEIHLNDSSVMEKMCTTRDWIDENVDFSKYESIYIPFGIRHCDHVALALAIKDLKAKYKDRKFPCWEGHYNQRMYMEYPYWRRLYNQRIVHDAINLLRLSGQPSFMTSSSPDPDKISTFRKVYPGQTSTLKWESGIEHLYEYFLLEGTPV